MRGTKGRRLDTYLLLERLTSSAHTTTTTATKRMTPDTIGESDVAFLSRRDLAATGCADFGFTLRNAEPLRTGRRGNPVSSIAERAGGVEPAKALCWKLGSWRTCPLTRARAHRERIIRLTSRSALSSANQIIPQLDEATSDSVCSLTSTTRSGAPPRSDGARTRHYRESFCARRELRNYRVISDFF